MNDIKSWQCLMETTKTKEGHLVEGHAYMASLKIIDEQVDRSYEILTCERCGHMDVSYSGSITHSNDAVFNQAITINEV